jgi:hypothetical protein
MKGTRQSQMKSRMMKPRMTKWTDLVKQSEVVGHNSLHSIVYIIKIYSENVMHTSVLVY